MSFWEYERNRLGVELNILGGDFTNLSRNDYDTEEKKAVLIESALEFVAKYHGRRIAATSPSGSEVSREPISAERWHQENRHKFLTGETVYPYGHSKEKIEYLDEVAMLRAYAHSLTTQNEEEK